MIRSGEKPLALIRCSFDQSQEIINKQEYTEQQSRKIAFKTSMAHDHKITMSMPPGKQAQV